MAKRVGYVVIDVERCKGCGLCVACCPVSALRLSAELNHRGYHPAQFVAGAACTGCGVCFYACPEPAALTVCFAAADGVA
jgi:ferredoxin